MRMDNFIVSVIGAVGIVLLIYGLTVIRTIGITPMLIGVIFIIIFTFYLTSIGSRSSKKIDNKSAGIILLFIIAISLIILFIILPNLAI